MGDYLSEQDFWIKAKANRERALALLATLEGRGFKLDDNHMNPLIPLEIMSEDLSLADDVIIRNVGKEDASRNTFTDFIDLIHYAVLLCLVKLRKIDFSKYLECYDSFFK